MTAVSMTAVQCLDELAAVTNVSDRGISVQPSLRPQEAHLNLPKHGRAGSPTLAGIQHSSALLSE